MKGGLACSLAAFKALVEARELRGTSGRLGFAMTVDQEGLSIGARALLATEYARCDAMLHAEHFYGDSPQDYLPIACTGKILYRLIVKGRAAHANRPHEGGINAIVDASRIVAALDQLRLREDSTFGKGTVCVLKMDGGYKQYALIVPDRCEVIINRLTVPGETREIVVLDMHELIHGLGLESEVEVETPPPSYEPYHLDPTSPIMTSFTEAYRQEIGTHPHFAGHRGIVDANVFVAEAGIPTIVFGPKGGNHHRPGEYVEKGSLARVATIYAETARSFLSTCQETLG
jgi:acetylornithine deacetylase/succinyl-diaminopimelate desuccinylase-like protein